MNRRLPSRLYAIADSEAAAGDVVELVEQFLAGGAMLIQLRCKALSAGRFVDAASRCRRLTSRHGALLIVNDRVDVAIACDADGVHLGQTDLPLLAARRLLGERRWIGISTHHLAQAEAAAAAGADYIGFGPLFPTRTKDTGYAARGLDTLRDVRRHVDLPIVAIGGISLDNAPEALAAGADAVAMISALAAASVPDRVRDVLTRLGPLDSDARPQQ